jgi:serine/threonine-protein kinase
MSSGKTILVSMVTAALTTSVLFFGLKRLTDGGPLLTGTLQVPSVKGLRPDQARMILGPMGLQLIISDQQEDQKVKKGHIIRQTPMEGSRVKGGSDIHVIISLGVEGHLVPSLAERPLTEAMAAISEAGLRVGAITRQPDDEVKAEYVISSIPAAGKRITPNTSVNLVVSSGPEEITVPKILWKSLARATQEIEKAGFTVGKVTYTYDEDHRGGIVLRQLPAAETKAKKGTAILLVVNETD